MAPHPDPIRALKTRLRAEALARRDALDPAEREAGSARIGRTVLDIPPLATAALVGGFWPIRSEVDPRPLMEALLARGQRIALPKTTKQGLIFREWRAGDELVSGGFGLSEPSDDLPEVDPDALIVPLAAYDRRGQRIGYGAGYYDRAIARLGGAEAVLTIGVAFSVQEIDAVPAEPHDRPLDHLVTERGPVALTPA